MRNIHAGAFDWIKRTLIRVHYEYFKLRNGYRTKRSTTCPHLISETFLWILVVPCVRAVCLWCEETGSQTGGTLQQGCVAVCQLNKISDPHNFTWNIRIVDLLSDLVLVLQGWLLQLSCLCPSNSEVGKLQHKLYCANCSPELSG